MSKSVDPDQTPRSVTFDLGLHNLLGCVCPKSLCNYGMEILHVTSVTGRKCLLSADTWHRPSLSLSLSLSLRVTAP